MFVCSPETLQMAIRQIKRWIYASEHDADPRIRLLHSNYAVGNLDLLSQMVPDERIRAATGEERLQLWARATKAQDKAQQYFVSLS